MSYSFPQRNHSEQALKKTTALRPVGDMPVPTHTKNNKIKNNLFSRKQNDSDSSRIKRANQDAGKQALKKPCIR